MTKNAKTSKKATTRREVIKRASYVVPAVLTLVVKPSFSAAASGTGARPRKVRPTP